MSSNNTKRANAWPRLFAGTLMGFGLMLMVVAGVNTHAGAITDDSTFIESPGAVAGLNPVVAVTTNGEQTPARPAQPPVPPQPMEPSETAPPAQPAQPAHPAQTAQPAQPAPGSQPTQPVPATPPAQPTQVNQAPPPPQPTFSAHPLPATPPTPPSNESRSISPPKQDDEQGGLIEAPQPVYPTNAMKNQVTGTVSVQVVIDENGKVISAKADNGPASLRAAAIDAAYKARFRPMKVKGRAVRASRALSYDFKLTDPDC